MGENYVYPYGGGFLSASAETVPAGTSTPVYEPYGGYITPGAYSAASMITTALEPPPTPPTTPPKADGANNAPPEWRCYKPGDLNPQLNSFSSLDVMGDSQLSAYSRNPMASIGEALGRTIRPDVTRGTKSSVIRAVVLGGYITEGQEARSYNMNVEPGDAGALANRAQVLYVRVPELTVLSDPYCNDNTFTEKQVEALVNMHPRATIPNWASTQPDIIPGTIVEVEFPQGYSLGIVKSILNDATSLLSLSAAMSAKNALAAGGAGSLLGISPTPDPFKVWDKLYQTLKSGNHWVKGENLSPKIKSIPSKLTAYLSSKGRKDVKVTSNGERRTVEATFKGGKGRIKTSLHMLGLGHDLQIHSEDGPGYKGVSKYGYAGDAPNGSNGILIKDHQLMRLMKSYAAANRLIWGGVWKQGNAESIPAGDGVAAFTAYTMELHHFQLYEADYAANIPASVLKALTDTGFTVADLKSSVKREGVYKRIASDVIV